jgi:hypothetical protein
MKPSGLFSHQNSSGTMDFIESMRLLGWGISSVARSPRTEDNINIEETGKTSIHLVGFELMISMFPTPDDTDEMKTDP